MKKAIKIISILFGVLLVLLVAGILALKKMYPPEKIKEVIVKQAAESLKREVRLGEVEIGLWSGISIAGFALSESPGFKNGTFVQSEKFILKFQLLPLIKKKVVIDEVSLHSPQIKVIQNADGKSFNFSSLMTPPAPEKPSATPETDQGVPSEPISLTVSKAKISKGKIEFVDRTPRQIKMALDPIDLTVLSTGWDKPLSLDCSIGAEVTVQKKNIKGNLKTKLVLDLIAQKLQIESLDLKMAELSLGLKGKVSNFIKPEIDLSASVQDVQFKELEKWAAIPKEVSLSGSPQFRFSFSGKLDDLDGSVSMDFSKVELAYSNLFKKGPDTDFSVQLDAKVKNQKEISINKLNIRLAALEAELKGRIENISSSDPKLKLHFQILPFELKEAGKVTSLLQPYGLGGKVGLKADVQGFLKLLQVKGALNLDQVGAKVEKIYLSELLGPVEFTENSASIPKLTGRIGNQGQGGSNFKIQASVKNFSKPAIFLDADFALLDLGWFIEEKKKEEPKEAAAKAEGSEKAAPAAQGPEIKAQGKIKIGKVAYTKFEGQNCAMSWDLTGITPSLSQVSGTAEFEMKDGKIKQIPALAAIAPVLRMDPSALVYSRMGGHFVFTLGKAKTEDFKINSPAADLHAKGTIHLPTNQPDLTLVAKLPKGSIGGSVGELSSDEEGRPTFSFKIKENWKVALDAAQVQKKVVEKATNEIKKKAAEALQNEGKKLLEGLFKR